MDVAIRNEILLIVFLALAIILFLCNFGLVGKAGDAVSDVMFGIFGLMAYVAPVIIFLAIAFGMSNAGNNIAVRKLIAGALIAVLIGMVFEMFAVDPAETESYQMGEIFKRCSERHSGGGVLAGSVLYASYKFLGGDRAGTSCCGRYLRGDRYREIFYRRGNETGTQNV